jgi:hypothetical protein
MLYAGHVRDQRLVCRWQGTFGTEELVRRIEATGLSDVYRTKS